MPRKPKSRSRLPSPSQDAAAAAATAAESSSRAKSSAVVCLANPVHDPAMDPMLDQFNAAVCAIGASNLSGKIKAPKPKTWPIRFQWIKLGFATLLTFYSITIVIPPNTAHPTEKAADNHGDAQSANKDAFVADRTVILASYGGAGGLFMLLVAYVLPLHLFTSREASSVAAQCPPWVHALATRLTRMRSVVLRYHHTHVSPLYQPLHTTELLSTVVCLGGVALRQWAFHTLKDKFTYAVRIFADHELIATGPYKTLLHPGYTGLLLALGGLFFYMGFRRSRFLVLMLMYMIPLCYRMINEEAALAEHFGQDKWAAHARGKYRLVPYLW